ncbi:MAG: radical SAM protein [Candidatus Jordarchaeaceae archaeon]
MSSCRMVDQGFPRGKCLTQTQEGVKPACRATLRESGGVWSRVIKSAHLSRPEDYFSIYQSGCNHACLKCHSWEFSQIFSGHWMSTDEIAEMCAEYEKTVTLVEPRERALMSTATDFCRHCGSCVLEGKRSRHCPGKLNPEQVVLSPQGWGPARNIVAFTGGDVVCCAEFYAEATRKIKEKCENIFVLIETNGYGLTPKNMDLLRDAGVDSFWLDIKAYDEKVYRRLCGTTNEWILKLPQELITRGFVIEVLTLYIPGWVEKDQIVKIAEIVRDADPKIPFIILAFFPQYKLLDVRPPTLMEMVESYSLVKALGLKEVKLGNVGIFAKTNRDLETLYSIVGEKGIG